MAALEGGGFAVAAASGQSAQFMAIATIVGEAILFHCYNLTRVVG